MDFPITDLMDEDACYQFLVQILHPDGLACPRCQTRDGLKVHKRLRAPILDYRCAAWVASSTPSPTPSFIRPPITPRSWSCSSGASLKGCPPPNSPAN